MSRSYRMDERTGIVYDIVDAKYGEVMSTNKAIDLTLIQCDVVGHFKWYRNAIKKKKKNSKWSTSQTELEKCLIGS